MAFLIEHTASEPPPQTVVSKVGPQTLNVTTNANKKKNKSLNPVRGGAKNISRTWPSGKGKCSACCSGGIHQCRQALREECHHILYCYSSQGPVENLTLGFPVSKRRPRGQSVPGRQMEKHVIGDVSAYLAATAPPFPKRIPTGTSEGLTGVHTPLEHHYLHKK